MAIDAGKFSLRGGRQIPTNRIIKIYGTSDDGDVDLLGVPLFYDGKFVPKVSSKFEDLFEMNAPNFWDLVTSSIGLGTSQFAIGGSQRWTETEPLTLDLSTHLYMNTSALNDVMLPAFKLMSMCLPTKSKLIDWGVGGETSGFKVKLETLIPPGPDLRELMQGALELKSENALSDWYNKGTRGCYKIQIGDNITIPRTIIKSVQPTFSSWTDSNGHPISAEISLEISTMEIASTDMIADMYRNINKDDLKSVKRK